MDSSDGSVNSSFIFDNLCAGLLTSLHLVQASVDEVTYKLRVDMSTIIFSYLTINALVTNQGTSLHFTALK